AGARVRGQGGVWSRGASEALTRLEAQGSASNSQVCCRLDARHLRLEAVALRLHLLDLRALPGFEACDRILRGALTRLLGRARRRELDTGGAHAVPSFE